MRPNNPYLEENLEEFAQRVSSDFRQNDHLGRAAAARNKAKEAVAARNFDAAWHFYHEQKKEFLEHAKRFNFTPLQALALDASVSEDLANILRIEGKHADAFVHVLYWVATSPRTTKEQDSKLGAYFRRCKFPGISETDMRVALEILRLNPQFINIRDIVGRWALPVGS